MTNRPSDRAIAMAFWEYQNERGTWVYPTDTGEFLSRILTMAKEIDAAAPEGAQPIGYFDPDVLAHLADGNIDPVGVLRRKPNKTSNVPVYTTAHSLDAEDGAKDREDALRYRWLVEQTKMGSIPGISGAYIEIFEKSFEGPDEITAEIDAARAAGGSKE